MSHTQSELKDCPFCGAQPQIYVTGIDQKRRYKIQCRECKAETHRSHNEEKAIAVWELRATAPQVPATPITSNSTELESSPKVPVEANREDMRAGLYRAAISCPHTIDVDKVVLYYDAKQPGHNALSQLADRLVAAVQVTVEANSKDALLAALVVALEESVSLLNFIHPEVQHRFIPEMRRVRAALKSAKEAK